MTKEQFVTRYIKDQKHRKHLKLWKVGHTDEEIAFACNTDIPDVRRWRKEQSLSENIVKRSRIWKHQSPLSKGAAGGYRSNGLQF